MLLVKHDQDFFVGVCNAHNSSTNIMIFRPMYKGGCDVKSGKREGT